MRRAATASPPRRPPPARRRPPAAGTAPALAGGAAEDSAAAAAPTMATGGSSTPIDVRSNFAALAAWVPSVATDAAGHATVDVALPDNLTRYRVMVVAAAGAQQFGTAEANITARLPLMVRPSAPRFANFGDRFELPVVVQNQTDAPMDVDVVLQTANLDPATPSGVRVTVPANDRVEVRFPVSVAAGRHGAVPGGRRQRRRCGRLGRRRAPGAHAGHRRGRRHVRRARRRRHAAAGGHADRRPGRSTAAWTSPPRPPRSPG